MWRMLVVLGRMACLGWWILRSSRAPRGLQLDFEGGVLIVCLFVPFLVVFPPTSGCLFREKTIARTGCEHDIKSTTVPKAFAANDWEFRKTRKWSVSWMSQRSGKGARKGVLLAQHCLHHTHYHSYLNTQPSFM